MSEHNVENTPKNNPDNEPEFKVEDSAPINIGGSIDKALVGEYKLNAVEIIKEAFQLTTKSRASINLGLLFSFSLGLLITLITSEYLGGIEGAMADPEKSLLLNIMVTVVVYPFLVGVEMMGIYHAIGLHTRMKLVFAFLKRGSWVVVCALITSSLISLGLTLILPAIYLAVALSLVLPLVVEKKLSPVKAIVLSLKATRFQWFVMLQLHLTLLAGLFFALLPIMFFNKVMPDAQIIGAALFVFILSYLAPMFYNVKGILYREIFGVTVYKPEENSGQRSDVFDA